jgi:hypothetical protein
VLPEGRACCRVASVTRDQGLRLSRKICVGASRPRRSRRYFRDAGGEIGEAGLIGEDARQSDLDAGDHLGDAGGDFD